MEVIFDVQRVGWSPLYQDIYVLEEVPGGKCRVMIEKTLPKDTIYESKEKHYKETVQSAKNLKTFMIETIG